MKRNVIATILLATATLFAVSCTEKESIQPVPEPSDTPETDTVRLALIHTEVAQGPINMVTNRHLTWENGLLMKTVDSIYLNGVPSVSLEEIFVYENGNCTEKYSVDGKYHNYYNYENGRLAKMLSVINGDTTYITDLLEWNADGHVTKAKFSGDSVFRYAYYTWRNDDVTQIIFDYIEPAASHDTVTYLYDSYPSTYTGYPLPLCFESLGFVTKASKHNVKSSGYTMNYENGRLVSEISDDDQQKTYYTYTDGTGRRD